MRYASNPFSYEWDLFKSQKLRVELISNPFEPLFLRPATVIRRKLHLFFLPVLFDKHFVTMNLVQMRPDYYHIRNTLPRGDVSKISKWIVKVPNL